MKCRRMLSMDVETVAGIEALNFSEPWSANSFYEGLNDRNYIFLVAEEANHVIGYVGMQCALDEGNIVTIAVAEAFRRRGASNLLFDTLISECRKRGINRLNLEVRVSNEPAIHMYEKQGFSRIGTRRRFYRLPTEDALLMTRYLI